VLVAPAASRAQTSHLTPVNYQKFAFVDVEKVRIGYIEYAAAKEKIRKEFVEKKKSYQDACSELEQQTKAQLKKDSIYKLQQRQQISDKADAKRMELHNQFMAGVKQQGTNRMALTKTYEEKIKTAVITVMREGAFTGMRSIKDSAGVAAIDITDKVLQKLNQNK
jgi:hypothetical protein